MCQKKCPGPLLLIQFHVNPYKCSMPALQSVNQCDRRPSRYDSGETMRCRPTDDAVTLGATDAGSEGEVALETERRGRCDSSAAF